MDFNNRFVQLAVLTLLSLIWGSSFILMKRGLVSFDSTEVAACRMSIAMLVLLPIALRNLSVARGRLLPLFITGLIGNSIPAFLFALAQTEIPSSLSGMLNSLTSLFTLVLGVLFFRLKSGLGQGVGVLLALFGALGLIGFGHLLQLSTHGRYALLIVGAAAMYGTAVNIIKSHLSDVRPHHITSLAFLFTAPFLLVYLLGFTDFVPQLVSDPQARRSFLYIALLGVVCTAFAVILFNRLISETSPVFASSVTYLIPVVAAGWGVLDGESIEIAQFGYLALILGGIFLIHAPGRSVQSR